MYYGRTLDDLAPRYVYKTFKYLRKNLSQMRKLQEQYDKLQKEHDALKDEKARWRMQDALVDAKNAAADAYVNIAKLAGSLMVATDIDAVSKILLQEYEAASAAFRTRDRLRLKRIEAEDLKENDPKNGKIAKIQSRMAELEGKLKTQEKAHAALRDQVENARKALKNHPEYAELEALRDDGIDLSQLAPSEMRRLRRDLQLIFQDPYSSLNPRMTVAQLISEGLIAHQFFKMGSPKMQAYVLKVMENCGLAPYMMHRYPHQFSGGQRQRIGIARSLALQPRFVVCDEAVSALDVSIQSQVLNLLLDMKEQEKLTYMFISHDLSVIKYISDRIGVMYLGNMVELSASAELFEHPLHPYTEALLGAIPTTDPDASKELVIIKGDIPSAIKPPKGCKFHTRCPYVKDICREVQPAFSELRPGHFVACHLREEEGA